jgi:hypothetical protein
MSLLFDEEGELAFSSKGSAKQISSYLFSR